MAEKNEGMGPIAIAVGADPAKRIVIFQFSGKIDRVEWSPEQARHMAEVLISRADLADGTVTQPPETAEVLVSTAKARTLGIAKASGLGPETANET